MAATAEPILGLALSTLYQRAQTHISKLEAKNRVQPQKIRINDVCQLQLMAYQIAAASTRLRHRLLNSGMLP